MIDSKKIEFKILESVTLGIDSIYVKCENAKELNFVNSWGIAPTFKSFERTKGKNVYKFYLLDEAIRFFRTVVSGLPRGWLVAERSKRNVA